MATNEQLFNAKQRFLQLLQLKEEHSHVDFKREFYRADHRGNDAGGHSGDHPEVVPCNEFLVDIMAMFNTPKKYAVRFDSLDGKYKNCASYLLFGVAYDPQLAPDQRFSAYPMETWNFGIRRAEETDLSAFVKDRLSCSISFEYFHIEIDADDTNCIPWLKPGTYVQLEIRRLSDAQPAKAKSVSSAAKKRGLKNQLVGKLYYRRHTESAWIPLPPVRTKEAIVLNDILEDFDAGYSQSKSTFDMISRTLKSNKLSFNILLTNLADVAAVGQNNTLTLQKAIGLFKWNLIFDFDENSRENGLLKHIKPDIGPHVEASWNDLKELIENEQYRDGLHLDDVQRGIKKLYFLVNEEAKSSKSPNTSKPSGAESPKKTAITAFQGSISFNVMRYLFKRMDIPRPLFIFILLGLQAIEKFGTVSYNMAM